MGVALLATGLLAGGGCQRASDPSSGNAAAPSGASHRDGAAPSEALSPEETLRRMVAAYRGASSYRDEGVFRAVLEREGERSEDSAPMRVAWSKPNRLAVRAYQAALASDGRLLHAKVFDDASGDLDGQIVERSVGDRLTLDELFSDAVLRESLGGRLGLHPLQLELLLAERPLQALLDRSVPKRFLEPAEFDGRACYRLAAEREGRYVFWIDRNDFLLRRFEYPGDALLRAEGSLDGSLTIVAEFPQAEIDAEIPGDRFSLAALGVTAPADATKVRFFVVPPQPLPTKMYGQRPTGFEFLTLDGGKVTPATLAEKVAVLIWFSNHPGSQACLQALDEVRLRLRAEKQIVFYAICTEPSSVSNEEVRRLVESWSVGMPVARDLGAYGRDAFDIRLAPSLVVLDSKGAVQVHESGDHPQFANLVREQLAELLPRLAGGEDFAAALLTQARAEEEAYRLNLQAASVGYDVQEGALPLAEVAAKTQPQHLRLSLAWANEEVESPGNLLVVESPQPRIFVLEAGRSVVEMDERGRVLRRSALDLPEDATVTYLRTSVDRQGRRLFAASALLAPQVHVFDGEWRRLVSYPPTEQEHEGVRDALLADLDDSGSPILVVGFWGLVGVQGVNLAGERLWSNRQLAPVLSVAATPPDVVGWRKVLAAGNAGHVLRLNQFGNADPPLHVAQRSIHHLIAAPWLPERPTSYLGLSYLPEGNLLAIGLNAEFQEIWSYRLPRGAYANQIQFATPCQLRKGDAGQWLLAGPDGSLHLIADDGEFFDYFQSGERLTGIAAVRTSAGGRLLAATERGVYAWSVEFEKP